MTVVMLLHCQQHAWHAYLCSTMNYHRVTSQVCHSQPFVVWIDRCHLCTIPRTVIHKNRTIIDACCMCQYVAAMTTWQPHIDTSQCKIPQIPVILQYQLNFSRLISWVIFALGSNISEKKYQKGKHSASQVCTDVWWTEWDHNIFPM